MKKLQFIVTLEFADKISDDNEIIEVAKNIARAIKNEVNHGEGIAPDDSDSYTLGGEVKPQFIDEFAPITI